MRFTRRRAAAILTAVLAAAALLLLLRPSDAPEDVGPALTRDEGEAPPAPPLRTEESPTSVEPPAVLVGRTEAVRDEEVAHGPMHVRVVGAGSQPIPGVRVVASGGAAPSVRETDAEGRASFDDLPYDGSVRLRFHLRLSAGELGVEFIQLQPWCGGPDGYEARGSDVLFVADTGLRLDVVFAEAETGRRLTGLSASIAGVEHTVEPRLLDEDAWLVFPPVEDPTVLAWKVEPPSSRLLWEPSAIRTCISRYATSLRLVFPLRLEHAVSVTVEESDGAPAAASLDSVYAAGRTLPLEAVERTGPGRFRVRGVPHLPGERVMVQAETALDDRVGSVTALGVVPDDPREDLEMRVRLPPLRWRGEADAGAGVIGIGGGAGGTFGGRGGHRTLTRGVTTIRVRLRDGRPAVGALVTIAGRRHYTDSDGRVRVMSLPPGVHRVTVSQVGVIPITASVTVPAGRDVEIELDEPPAAAVDVEVVDDRGRALPFAALAVKTPSGEPWVDLQDGIQRLDPYTDHEGRRRLHNLEPGDLRLTVTWGSRKQEVHVAAASSDVTSVRVVLPRPDAVR